MAAALGAAAAVLAYLVMPTKPPLSGPDIEGDPAVARSVERTIQGNESFVQGLAALEVRGGQTRSAYAGDSRGGTPVTARTPFATGSVFKMFTAMTLADLAADGETSPDRTLGEVFPDMEFASQEIADTTLQELAEHRGGLPRIPEAAEPEIAVRQSTLTDPFRGLPPVRESLAEAEPLPERPDWQYSPFGYAVLGAALAEETGTPFPQLVRERVLDPLGMDDTVMRGADMQGLPQGAAVPHGSSGRPLQAWKAPGYIPAGVGTWSTAADLERFLRAVMAGTAPGTAAIAPARDGPVQQTRMGLEWLVNDFGSGVRLVQHGAGTYGSSAYLGFRGDHGVIVLSSSYSADAAVIGPRLMGAPGVPPQPEADALPSQKLGLATTLPLVVLPPVLALALMLRRRTLVGQRPLDQLRVVSMTAGTSAVLVMALMIGDWVSTSPVVWAVAVGAVVAAGAVGAWFWSRVPTAAGRWRWLRVACFSLSVFVSGCILVSAVYSMLAAFVTH